MSAKSCRWVLLLLLAQPFVVCHAARAVTPTVAEVEQQVAAIETLIQSRKLDEAGPQLAAAAESWSQALAGASADDKRRLGKLRPRLAALRKQLAAQGIELPSPSTATGRRQRQRSTATAETPQISFADQVLPILTARCGRCHVQRRQGGLSLASYDDLARGAASGPVVVPGNPAASRLIDVIVQGEMPRGGGMVPPEELQVLTAWIAGGAGNEPATPRGDRGGDNAPSKPRPAPTSPGTPGTVSFARDIAPVLVENCQSCHGAAQRSGGLSLATYRDVLTGGGSGVLFEPGQPADSLLLAKLQGTAADGQRMPLRRAPLDPPTIAKIETWIAEGARLDEGRDDEPLTRLAARATVAALSAEDLAERRLSAARAHWKLALPDEPAAEVATDRGTLLGNLSEPALRELAQSADALWPKVQRAIAVGPSTKGDAARPTILVFARAADLAEFARMVEKQELLPGRKSLWRAEPLDAFAGLLAAPDSLADAAPLLAEALAGWQLARMSAYAATPWPEWFARGAARAVAARAAPRAAEVSAWESAAAAALAERPRAEALLASKIAASDADALGFAVALPLIRDAKRSRALWTRWGRGEPFEQALEAASGQTLAELLNASASPSKTRRAK